MPDAISRSAKTDFEGILSTEPGLHSDLIHSSYDQAYTAVSFTIAGLALIARQYVSMCDC